MPSSKHERNRFSRNKTARKAEMREELRAMGIKPIPDQAEPLPAATTRASRPDMKPAFNQGVASARRIGQPTTYTEPGDNSADTNVFPDSRVAENGVPREDRGIDPHGRASRKRPGEP